MPIYECAICQQPVRNALTCRKCCKTYPLDTPWAEHLCQAEKRYRNLELKDARHGLFCLSDLLTTSDGQTYDGWDMLDGDIGWKTSTSRAPAQPAKRKTARSTKLTDDPAEPAVGDSVFGPTEEEQLNRYTFAFWDDEEALRLWAEKAHLTPGEHNAVYVQATGSPELKDQLSSVEGAAELSELENRSISPVAYRRRLSDARRKLRKILAPKLRAG